MIAVEGAVRPSLNNITDEVPHYSIDYSNNYTTAGDSDEFYQTDSDGYLQKQLEMLNNLNLSYNGDVDISNCLDILQKYSRNYSIGHTVEGSYSHYNNASEEIPKEVTVNTQWNAFEHIFHPYHMNKIECTA